MELAPLTWLPTPLTTTHTRGITRSAITPSNLAGMRGWGLVLTKIIAAIWADDVVAGRVRLAREKLQVFWSIIIPNTISVVYDFTRKQRSAEFLRHDETVLKNVSFSLGVGVCRQPYHNVSTSNLLAERTRRLVVGNIPSVSGIQMMITAHAAKFWLTWIRTTIGFTGRVGRAIKNFNSLFWIAVRPPAHIMHPAPPSGLGQPVASFDGAWNFWLPGASTSRMYDIWIAVNAPTSIMHRTPTASSGRFSASYDGALIHNDYILARSGANVNSTKE